MKISIGIPAYNEEKNIAEIISKLKKITDSIIVCDDGSSDLTGQIARELGATTITHEKNLGYGAAIIEGLNKSSTEYSCIINADGSMNPEYLDLMLKVCKDYELVFASRYIKPDGGSEDDTVITFIGNKIFSLLGNILYKLEISDILFTYILGKTNSFKQLNLSYNDFRLCVEIPIKAKKKGLKYTSIPCFERNRIAGKKKVNAIKDGFLILLAILKFIF